MLGQISVHFCEVCCEFGVVSVVNGKLDIQFCDCPGETLEGK
jgi:hypothetical protein